VVITKNHHHEKENYNNDIAYRGVCSVKHKLCPTTAHETATSPARRTLNRDYTDWKMITPIYWGIFIVSRAFFF
jgi:hypothetical protein